MAEQIKGITVEIGGNTVGLNKALQTTNKEINSTQKELREVEKALKLDPTNTDLLRQRQELLAKSVQETKAKVEALKAAKEKADSDMANGTEVNQEQYRKLQREIAVGEASLKSLEKQASRSNAELSKISAVSDKIANSAGNISKKMAPATLAIAGFGTVCFNAASDVAESQNKVEVAFGDSADAVKKFAETTLDMYGIAKGTSLDMSALFGDMATSMGLTQPAAADMSTTLTGLAGDLASFKNIGIDEAMTALKGIFTGETESLKNIGVVMTQDNLLLYAMEHGMIDTSKSAAELQKQQVALEKAQKKYNDAVKKHGESSLEARDASVKMADAQSKLSEGAKATLDDLTEAEKVQLRYAYVMDKTKNAQGDFARTSDGAANSVRIAKESLKEASAELGDVLLPTITSVIQAVTNAIKAFSNMSDSQKTALVTVLALVAAISPVAGIIGGIAAMIGTLSSALAIFTGTAATGTAAATGLAKIIAALTSPITWVVAIVVAAVATIAIKGDEIQSILQKVDAFMQNVFARDWTTVFGPILGNAMNGFLAGFKNIWDSVQSILNGIIDIIRGVFTGDWSRVWNGVKEVFKGVMDSLVNITRAPMNGIIGLLNGAVGAINSLIQGFNKVGFTMPKWLGGGSWHPNLPNIPSIPYLAKGGTVLSGSAVVGEAGPELLTVLGNKTMVQPLTSQQKNVSYGGNVINVYGAPGQDIHALAKIVADEVNFGVQQRGAAFA